MNFYAFLTNSSRIKLFVLSLMVTNPSNTPFVFNGSLINLINPILVSTIGSLSKIQNLYDILCSSILLLIIINPF